MRTRFAPSPTGLLHLGHAYSALLAWEEAGREARNFILRFEDIDHTRVREPYYEQIVADLSWLGIRWEEEPLRQLDRLAVYEGALGELREKGLLYPCFCTRKELVMTAPQQGDELPIYGGKCRRLSESEQKHQMDAGRSYSWRLDGGKALELVGEELSFFEERQGEVPVGQGELGDPILARKDIATSYHLAVVVDDAQQGVGKVVRGQDLFSSTFIHRVLQHLLGLPTPRYYHHSLVVDEEGKRLAKRNQARAICELREQGYTPEEVRELAMQSLTGSRRE